jgi:RNA polymerase sigma-70 factor (ECF subfamily)
MKSEFDERIRDLYNRYGSVVHSRCRYILGSEDEAWDATQEVFIKLVKWLPVIDKKESVFSWLTRTATNHCISILRKKRGIGFDETVHSGGAEGWDPEKRMVIREIMQRLMEPWDKKTRQIVVYTYIDGYTQEEIARLTGMGESTIRKYLTRFRRASALDRERIEGAAV